MNHDNPLHSEEDELYFDDQPVGELLLGGRRGDGPSPTDVVKQWILANGEDSVCGQAVCLRLALVPDLAEGLPRADLLVSWLQGLSASCANDAPGLRRNAALHCAMGELQRLAGELLLAEQTLREALRLLESTTVSDLYPVELVERRILRVLEKGERHEQARLFRREREKSRVTRHAGLMGSATMRYLAYQHFMDARYEEAERLLRILVERRYELVSTHGHLARLCLLTGREEEARRHVAAGRALVGRNHDYASLRIPFYEALLAMLAAGDARGQLREIAVGLRHPYNTLEWSVQAVIDHFAERLGQRRHALLSLVATAMNTPEEAERLEGRSLWREFMASGL